MKKSLIALIILLYGHLYAQAPFGNEWIDYSKPHFKIFVAQNAVYRIPYSTLLASIPGLSGIDPADFAMYNNGVQVPIYITWSGTPNSADYIEFFGKKNTGETDSKLYLTPQNNLNPFQSFISDTAIYYLTFRSGAVNKRLTTIPNDLTGVPAKEAWFFHTTLIPFSNIYNPGKRTYFSSKDYIHHPAYDAGEGFGSTPFIPPYNTGIVTPFVNVASGVQSSLRFSLLSYNAFNSRLTFSLNTNLLKDTSFVGTGVFNFNLPFQTNFLTTNNTFLLQTLVNISVGYSIGYFQLTYPRNYNFGNASSFSFPIKNNGNRQYIEVSGFSTNVSNPILFDIANGHRIVGSAGAPGALLRFSLPPAIADRDCYLYNENNFVLVGNMIAKTFFNFNNPINQGDYILVYHKKLTVDGMGNNSIIAYKNFRESFLGGSYKVALADFDEVVEQFAFGIPKHPLGLKKFLQYAMLSWGIKPKQTFIVGKGVAQDINKSASNYPKDLIPPFGQPPSDILYGTWDSSYSPFMSIGRLGAITGDEVNIYLNKVKEYETAYNLVGDPNQTSEKNDFKKWAIHLGGGTGPDQQGQYRFALQNFEARFKGPFTGGNVLSMFKDNSNPQQNLTTEQLRKRINTGTSLITFFGHSASTVFDIAIDEPERFTNVGKYPFFLANGCNAGYIFDPVGNTSYSDRFVKLANKGSIAFLATANFSFDDALIEYCRNFYSNLTTDHYGKTYGEICQKTSEEILSINGPNNLNHYNTTSLEYIYQGDPALRPNFYNKPDYILETQNISFIPGVVNTSADSFDMRIKVVNLGKAIQDSILLTVTRSIDNNQYYTTQKMRAPLYIDSITIKLPVLIGQSGVGINKFDLFIEAENKIDELSETNNYLNNQVSMIITSDEIYPVSPYEFSIVNKQEVELKASTSDVFSPMKTYVFEIDTSASFNSPSKLFSEVNSIGGVVSWKPNTFFFDSIVYYWRVSTKSANPKWHVSSFIFLSNSPEGWNISHYDQQNEAVLSNLSLNPSSRQLQFSNNLKTIVVRTTGDNVTNAQGYGIEWELNNARQQAFREHPYINSGLNFVWIKGSTGLPVACIEGTAYASYGSVNSFQASTKYGFVFRDTGLTPANHPTRPNQPWSAVINDFLAAIPIGDYVIMYTLKKPDYSKWDIQLRQNLILLGASNVATLVSAATKAPFIFACKKGDLSFTPIQKIGASFSGTTDTAFGISGIWKEGFFNAPIIGPAKEWTSFHWRNYTLENPTFDQNEIKLFGINTNNDEVFLGNINVKDTLINDIDAAKYPYLKIQVFTKDDTSRTPTQINYLRVHYKPYPDLAINPLKHFVFNNKLLEGEKVSLEIAVENVSPFDMDTVWNKFDIQANNNHQYAYTRIDSIKSGQFAILKFNSDQAVNPGRNFLLVETNPLGNLYRNEQFHFNNYANLSFDVAGDNINPLLDVTFDGEHIMNRDLVSSSPKILIRLKDENNFLLLKDTSVLAVSIKYPDGRIQDFNYTDPRVKFTPAAAGDKVNQAMIEINATFGDSIHELMVIDKDVSGNRSGVRKSYDYKVAFDVMNKQTVTRLLNYPNPFTTRTQFIFTLTGNKVPDQIKIQIMTITGKVVREIFKEELGPLKIGVNKTAFWWDGTDAFGDKLANGVYLYRVVVKENNQDVTIRETNNTIQKAFKGNLGKMVILR